MKSKKVRRQFFLKADFFPLKADFFLLSADFRSSIAPIVCQAVAGLEGYKPERNTMAFGPQCSFPVVCLFSRCLSGLLHHELLAALDVDAGPRGLFCAVPDQVVNGCLRGGGVAGADGTAASENLQPQGLPIKGEMAQSAGGGIRK